MDNQKETSIIETNSSIIQSSDDNGHSSNHYNNINDNTINDNMNHMKFKNNNKGKKKKSKIWSYVVVGLVCSIIGGTISTAASLYLLPNSNLFKNSPLYKSMYSESKSSGTISPAPISSKGGLTVAEIAKKVGPAVVGVSTKSPGERDMFGFKTGENEGIGSGIIINEEGYILTNHHVITGATTVSVILNNKKEVPAKIINYDADLDLAVIKVTENIKMPAVAELGSSKNLQVGDSVVAIGNPLGKELLGSVTTGIISSANRELNMGNSKQTLLQTDAAINPGNSGGALVNSAGQVIGVNSSKIGGDGVEGIGFAIPIDVVKPKIDTLLKPILKVGIVGRDIDEKTSKRYDIPEGIYVVEVQEFSAAEKAGITPGDIIQKFDGKKVKSISEMNKIKESHKSGDTLKVEVIRESKSKTLDLKLTDS